MTIGYPSGGARNEPSRAKRGSRMTVAGLFAGIGGIELGLHEAGLDSEFLCDNEPASQAVLEARFPGLPIVGDVREIRRLPSVDVVAAGFPCQDLSQAGRTAGIEGDRSGLIDEVFRLVSGPGSTPRWLLLENVPFMLQLDRGRAMHYLTEALADLGLMWAYRVIDTRAFGIPQRRQRVIVLASKTEDPRTVLFRSNAEPREARDPDSVACGFYWTEGTRGLGWAVNAVPTLKGGSTIGIPSPPAIRFPDSATIVTPDLRDAERLQGFPADWTEPASSGRRRGLGARWKLVGNAVSVPLARWVGEGLVTPGEHDVERDRALDERSPWPVAAWGRRGEVFATDVSRWPVIEPYHDLAGFLEYTPVPLSQRATAGFLKRARSGNLRFADGFLDAVESHLAAMTNESALR